MSADEALEISFPVSTSADATRLARTLRSELADGGLPADGIKVVRADPENMDAGSLLEITTLVVETIVAVHGVFQFYEIVLDFVRRTGSAIKVRSPVGEIDIRPDTREPQQL